MAKRNDIVVKVYLPSISEYDKYYDKFSIINHQFAADLMPTDFGEPFTLYGDAFTLRNADQNNPKYMWAAKNCGFRLTLPNHVDENGMIVGFKLPFNKNADYVKSAIAKPFKNFVHYNYGKSVLVDGGGWRNVQGEVDVITVGGRPFMWANAQDCRAGKCNIMDCFSIEYLGAAPTFKDSDYGKDIDKLQKIEDMVFATFSAKEKAAIIRVVLSSSDNYDKATPYLQYNMGRNC